MITVVCGKPRGGKSLWATMQVAHELRNSSRYVVTNLPLDVPALSEWLESKGSLVDLRKRLRLLTDEETHHFWLHDVEGEISSVVDIGAPAGRADVLRPVNPQRVTVPDFSRRQAPDYPGVLYVIDEAHIYFSARNWAGQADVLSFFLSQHGHMRTDVIFISQHPAKLTKHIRLDAGEYVVCSNLGNEKGWLGVSVHGLFRRATYLDLPGGTEKPVETGHFRLNVREFGQLYSTSAGVGLSGRVDTQEQKKGRHWRTWVFAGAGVLVAGLLLPVLIMYGFRNVFRAGVGMFLPSAPAPAVASSSASAPSTSSAEGSAAPVRAVVPLAPVVSFSSMLSEGVELTGVTPAALAFSDGSILWRRDGYFWDSVPGGVLVQGSQFVPWVRARRASGSSVSSGVDFSRPVRAVKGRPSSAAWGGGSVCVGN